MDIRKRGCRKEEQGKIKRWIHLGAKLLKALFLPMILHPLQWVHPWVNVSNSDKKNGSTYGQARRLAYFSAKNGWRTEAELRGRHCTLSKQGARERPPEGATSSDGHTATSLARRGRTESASVAPRDREGARRQNGRALGQGRRAPPGVYRARRRGEGRLERRPL